MPIRLLAAPLSLALLAASPAPKVAKPDAREIHGSSLVVDTHADTTQRFLDEQLDFAKNTPIAEGHMDLAKIRQGNLGAEFFSIWVDPSRHTRFAHRALHLIDSLYEQARKHPDQMAMAFSSPDILAARQGENKKLAALMGVEGGHAIENDLGILRDFHRLGVRYMTLTWSNTNELAYSSADINKNIPHHNGLTYFGKQVVREMNRLGMMVDVSHVADKTFWDVLATATVPPFASHSSCRAFCNAPRDMTDEMIVALAKKGGVAQINFECSFLSQASRDADLARRPRPEATLADVGKNIAHGVK